MSDECRTVSVPRAGKLFFGLGRNGSYEAAKRGDIPTIRIGRKLRVPIAALERMLDAAGTHAHAPGPLTDLTDHVAGAALHAKPR